MTFKEKYNSIDQSKLPETAKAYMADFKKDSDNFTNKQAMALMMPVLDRFIKGLKDSGYGDAIKGGAKKETKKAETPKEMAKEIVEEAVEQPETKTGKPKVGKISKGDFMKIAKEIRKEGESWNSAMKRAGEIIRTQKEVVKKEATRQYEKLKKFIEKHPEVYPMDIPVQGGGFRRTTVSKDAPRVALPKGKRVSRKGWKNQYGKSEGGNKYYEYRSNRYDTRRKRYPFLAEGGEVDAIFAGGGDIPENKSLKYFILNEASSGSIANKTPYTDYKDIEGVRKTAVDILKRYGDVEYTLKSFNDLIEKAAKDYLPEEISKELVDLGESRYVHTSLDTENDKILVVSSQYFADKIHLRTGVDSYGRKLTPQIRKRLTAQMKANIGGSYPIKYREAIENFFEVWFKKYKKYANGGELDGNLVVINYGGDRYDGGVVWAIEENGVQIANGIIDGDWGVDFRGKHYDGLLSLAKGINAKLVNKFDSDDYAKGGELKIYYAIVDENTDRIYVRNSDKTFIDKKYKELKEIYPNDKLSIVEFPSKMAKGGELDINKYAGAGMFARGGYMSKGELVWNKLSTAKRHDFLHEHFHPEMTPRSIEILVNKSYNFLPKKVKIKMESVYANVEEYAGGGKTNEKLDLLENELTAAGIYVQRLLDMEKVPYLTIFAKSDPVLENNFFFINKSGKYEMGNHYWDGDSEKAHVFDNIESIMKYVRSENFKTITDKQMEGKYAKGGNVDRFKDFDLNEEGNFEATIDGKKYEIIYRDDVSRMYDLFVDGKKIKSSKIVREVMTFAKGGEIKMGDNVHIIGENKSGFVTNVISHGKHFTVKFIDGTQTVYDKHEIEKILDEGDYDEYANGGYIATGENYEYTNYFGIEQDDFEQIVEIWHKWENISEYNPNYGKVRDEYLSMFNNMESKYGADKIYKVIDYIEETHLSHREEEVKSDLIDEINDMSQESFMKLCDDNGIMPNDWELFVNAMDYNNAEELLVAIRNNEYEVGEYDTDEYANGGKVQNRYKVYIYGDSGRPTVKYANTIEEAKELSFQGEHAEIIDITTNQMVDPFEFAKGGRTGKIDYSKQTTDDFTLGEIVWDVENRTYGTIIGIYDDYPSSKYELRLDSDGMQPTENLRKLGSKGDNGTKEQLNEAITQYASLVKEYGKNNNYPKQIKPENTKGGSISKSTTYIPNRDIESVNAKIKNKKMSLKGSDILDGVYAKNEALKKPFDKYDAYNEIADLADAAWDELKLTSGSQIYSSDSVQKKLADFYEKSGVDAAYLQFNTAQRKKIAEVLTDENQHSLRNYFALRGYSGVKEYNDYKSYYEEAIKEKRKIYLNPSNIEHQPKKKFAKGGMVDMYKIVRGYDHYNDKPLYTVESTDNNPNEYVGEYHDNIEDAREELNNLIAVHQSKNKYAKGGKIGFKGLSEKVAKYYANKSVPSKYQTLYGKKYDKAEAKEVGDKVAAKVYRQQQSKKK